MSNRKYVLLDHNKEKYPAIRQGTEAEMQEELEKLTAKDTDKLRYEIMPYDVYELAFGFELSEKMNGFNKS